METEFIRNAIISSTSIETGDRGLLTAWLNLEYDSGGQGFGGFALYLPERTYKHHGGPNFGGHFIFRCMEIAGVENWQDIKGKSIRVKLDCEGFSGKILAIGHIIKDDWFNPSEDFKKMNLVYGKEN